MRQTDINTRVICVLFFKRQAVTHLNSGKLSPLFCPLCHCVPALALIVMSPLSCSLHDHLSVPKEMTLPGLLVTGVLKPAELCGHAGYSGALSLSGVTRSQLASVHADQRGRPAFRNPFPLDFVSILVPKILRNLRLFENLQESSHLSGIFPNLSQHSS